MKEPSERSEKEKELLKGMSVTDMEILSYDKAVKIARELKGFSKDRRGAAGILILLYEVIGFVGSWIAEYTH